MDIIDIIIGQQVLTIDHPATTAVTVHSPTPSTTWVSRPVDTWRDDSTSVAVVDCDLDAIGVLGVGLGAKPAKVSKRRSEMK